MKRFLSIFLSGVIALSLSACGQETQESSEPASVQEEAPSLPDEPVRLEGEISGEITVAAYEAMTHSAFLEEAARSFEAKYPGTIVNVDVRMPMPEPRTVELEDGTAITTIGYDPDPDAISDYLTQVNTEMMSGGGADVYAMDVLPYYKYAESGMLENLNGYMDADEDFNPGDYWMNVLDGTKYKGGQFILPTDFNFSVLCYDTTLVDDALLNFVSGKEAFTYDELIAAAKESFTPNGPEGSINHIFNFYSGEHAFSELFANRQGEFLDVANRKAEFNDGRFAELLNEAADLEKAGYVRENEIIDFDTIDFNEYLSRPQQVYNYYFSTWYHSMLNQLFLSNSDMMLSYGADPGSDENAEIAGMVADAQGNIDFGVSKSFGINSNSNNKRTAWEFVKFLLSYDMQMSPQFFGQPINKKAGEDKAEGNFTGAIYYSDQEEAPKIETEEERAAFESYKEAIAKYSAMVNHLSISDNMVSEIIDNETRAFFNGEKTAEDAAAVIQNKVGLYLSE